MTTAGSFIGKRPSMKDRLPNVSLLDETRRNKHVPTCICLRFLDLYWPWIIQHVSCILRGGYELRSRGIIDWHKHILNVIAFGMISFGFHF
jgi:hypothetical protein